MSNLTMAFSFGISFILIGVIFLIAVHLNESKRHVVHEGQPTTQGSYLTYIKIIKTAGNETAEENRWEILYFYPNSKFSSDWNTIHLGDWKVDVLYWTYLPPAP